MADVEMDDGPVTAKKGEGKKKFEVKKVKMPDAWLAAAAAAAAAKPMLTLTSGTLLLFGLGTLS